MAAFFVCWTTKMQGIKLTSSKSALLLLVQLLGDPSRPVKTLTDDACSRWLADRAIEEAPYGRLPYQAPWCKQFPLSDGSLSTPDICRCFVEVAEPFGEALLHVTDWSLYQPDEMAVVSTLRVAHGEQRLLIESPGHLFAAAERDLLIGMVSLVVFYGWTAYLYFDHRTTFLCWEGDLLDV